MTEFGIQIVDLDNDGKLELITGSESEYNKNIIVPYSSVMVWETDIVKSGFIDWPMFQHDSQHTGNYNFGKRPQSKPQSKIVNNENFDLIVDNQKS